MTMLWVGAGVAVLGAGASIYGSNKQAKASKQAANLNMDQYALMRGDQQPFVQSGYGAMSKLNTLLGLSPNPNQRQMLPSPQQSPGYRPTPGGAVEPIMQTGQAPPQHQWNVPEAGMGSLPLSRILMIRAQHGDTQAQQMLQRMR